MRKNTPRRQKTKNQDVKRKRRKYWILCDMNRHKMEKTIPSLYNLYVNLRFLMIQKMTNKILITRRLALGQLILYWHNIPPDETFYTIVGFEYQCLWRDHLTFKNLSLKTAGSYYECFISLVLSGQFIFMNKIWGQINKTMAPLYKFNGRSLKLTCN